MKEELKSNWIEALRSGKYKQGRVYLRQADAFCCLGVLCEIANIPAKLDSSGKYVYDGLVCSLSDVLLDKFRISKADTEVLVCMNDGGTTFTDIAAWIDKYVNRVPA